MKYKLHVYIYIVLSSCQFCCKGRASPAHEFCNLWMSGLVYNSSKCKLEMDHIEANKSPTENAGILERSLKMTEM